MNAKLFFVLNVNRTLVLTVNMWMWLLMLAIPGNCKKLIGRNLILCLVEFSYVIIVNATVGRVPSKSGKKSQFKSFKFDNFYNSNMKLKPIPTRSKNFNEI